MRRLATALTLLGSLCVGYAGQVVTPAAQTSPPWLPRDGGRPPRAGQPVDARRPTIPLAWTYVRSRLPRDVTVLRPGWLPARFRTAPVIWPGSVQNSRVFGTTYNVGYRSIRGDVVQFALGSVNSGPPDTQERIRVRGVQGTLAVSSQKAGATGAVCQDAPRMRIAARGAMRLARLGNWHAPETRS